MRITELSPGVQGWLALMDPASPARVRACLPIDLDNARVEQKRRDIQLHHAHEDLSAADVADRALARELWQACCTPDPQHELPGRARNAAHERLPAWRERALRIVSAWAFLIVCALLLIAYLLAAPRALAQGVVAIRQPAFGTTPMASPTVEAFDANRKGLDIICLQGCGGAGGTQDVNLKQYGGGNVGATNAQYVQPGTGAIFPASQNGTWNISTLTSITNPVAVTQSTSPWVVSAASLPLPANAAQESGGNLDSISASNTQIQNNTKGAALDATLSAVLQQLAQLQGVLLRIPRRDPLANAMPVEIVSQMSPAPLLDPCGGLKSNAAVSQTANALVVNGQGSKRIYMCGALVVGADAENLSWVEGTGSACGTSTAAVVGGSTAANGPNFAANTGYSSGMGLGTIAATKTQGDDLCLFQSGAGRVAGNITFAYGP